MNLYVALFESVLECGDRIGVRLGIVYTTAMAALGLCLCLNLLSVVDLLWSARVLHHPYGAGGLHPQHYVYALLYGCILVNTILARVKFRADRHCLVSMADDVQLPVPATHAVSLMRMPGTAYIIGSAGVFLVTLTAGLLQ